MLQVVHMNYYSWEIVRCEITFVGCGIKSRSGCTATLVVASVASVWVHRRRRVYGCHLIKRHQL